ncbi:sulfonate ABC transporter substrate-binding protein [Dendronalium sp. ChiSLP03b]|uniref:sulfonate ABC transporter substrate-binding protein n=1 Tax=Dendronalium sp. ChiSLP03b TaxID=3075381 RepID=UPI002AD2ABEF|nr:sulfonate ABC transporter substrate-binding protein [Dendronalium sp. ChiSLP03b]MDZ8206490.1 sulfonate ABC transporter substrate-binding protein [Dendronalium sp. ChiSLP03b]
MKIVSNFLQNNEISRICIFALFFTLGLGLSLIISACSPDNASNSAATQTANQNSTNQGVVVRIGYQKAATILNAIRTQKDLEKAFEKSGASVTWAEFPSGPPMLEAINAGSIDFGYTGESPPIFAQVAGTPLVYVAYDPWSPKAEAILVPKNSSIQTLADLKGKRVAVAKGSNTNYLLVKALEKGGVKYNDIKPAFLQPPDARAAFEGNNIDAWAIWDPYLAAAVAATGARTLTDATGLAPNRGYYLAAKSFAQKHPDALKTVIDEVKKTSNWAQNNPTEVAKFLAPELGIDARVLEIAEKRREYGVLPITDEVISGQQQIADTFYKIKLIPKSINVSEIVWKGN